MSYHNIEDQDLLRNEECSSKLSFPKNKNAVHLQFAEQLLVFLVGLHSDYLETHYFPDGEQHETLKLLKGILTEAPGKIFPVNLNFDESQDDQDDTMLEYLIELVNSKCKDVLGGKGTDEKHSIDETEKKFYQKLSCLLNGANTDCATRSNKETKHNRCRNMATPRSNCFGYSTCSVEQRVNELEAMVKEKEATISTLEENLKRTEEALNEIATEYYNLNAEIARKRREALFREVLQLNRGSTSSTETPQSRSEETSDNISSDSESQMSKEESSSKAEQTLTNVPTNAIERELYNIYKLLLLQISERLLGEQKEALKDWAASTYSVENSADAYQILVELDKKGIISSSNLTVLRDFFDGIIRIDLVVIIDCFLAGDYQHLRSTRSARNENQRTRGNVAPSANRERPMNAIVHPQVNAIVHPEDQATNEDTSSKFSVEEVAVGAERRFGHRVANEQSLLVTTGVKTGQVVVHGAHNDAGSNGNKLSKPQRSSEPQQRRNENRQGCDSSVNNTNGGPWLCDHYKRRCLVKFDCCEKHWPCHRCHNNKSNCGRKKLKSRDIRSIKCGQCQREQPFNEGSQFCCGCGIKFAQYFCARCKHLTGLDDTPYHCDKCGICRIHGDRSFHCDVCGVCLDVQLQNNHKCRAGSAHDECCICLEDAFTGCQILPCSHKVHKECASQMIRSGITRCPICRESFAHKLERRPITKPFKKQQGKK